jgi:RHS repeat-associated protein
MAQANTFRFSTKYQDDETDLPYYGYRYYNASTGRWLSRDPMRERGGKNLYALLNNAPLNSIDKLGCCKCGPDVTSAVNRVLDEVGATYRGWDAGQKKSACSAIIGQKPDVPAKSSWEINELGQSTWFFESHWVYSNPLSRGSRNGCTYTVQFLGLGCFHAAQANYALYGKMFSLCADSGVQVTMFGVPVIKEPFTSAGLDFFIKNYKLLQYQQTEADQEVKEALDFGHYGFGDLSGFHTSLVECGPAKEECTGSLNWTWEPIKARVEAPLKLPPDDSPDHPY